MHGGWEDASDFANRDCAVYIPQLFALLIASQWLQSIGGWEDERYFANRDREVYIPQLVARLIASQWLQSMEAREQRLAASTDMALIARLARVSSAIFDEGLHKWKSITGFASMSAGDDGICSMGAICFVVPTPYRATRVSR